MTVTFAGKEIEEMELQPWKALCPTLVTVLGSFTDVSAAQPLKVSFSIATTPSGISTDGRAMQPEKAPAPRVTNAVESFTFTNAVQSLNTLPQMMVTELGIITEVRPVQPRNALSPIVFKVEGNVIEVIPLQPEKASREMPLTEYSVPLFDAFEGITMSPE